MASEQDILDLCASLRTAVELTFAANASVGATATMSNNIDKCITTPLVCAKLFAVLALAAHELAESLPGATVIERACLEAAYSDLKQSPIAARRFRQNTSSSTSSVLHRETRKMETHTRRAAEEGYRRALVQSYGDDSLDSAFRVQRVTTASEEIVSMSTVELLLEANALCETVQPFVVDQSRNASEPYVSRPLEFLWLWASFHGRRHSSATARTEPLEACLRSAGTTTNTLIPSDEKVNLWGVPASLILCLLQSAGIFTSPSRDGVAAESTFSPSSTQRGSGVWLSDLSFAGVVHRCLTSWRRQKSVGNSGQVQGSTMGKAPPQQRIVFSDASGTSDPNSLRAAFTGMLSPTPPFLLSTPTSTHPFSSHLSLSSYVLDGSSLSHSTKEPSSYVSLLKYAHTSLYQQSRNLLGLPYDPDTDALKYHRAALSDNTCPMSVVRQGRCGWSCAARAASFAICFDIAWGRVPTTTGDEVDASIGLAFERSAEKLGYFSTEEIRLPSTAASLSTSNHHHHQSRASLSPPLEHRVAQFIGGSSSANSSGQETLTTENIASFFSVLCCRVLSISSSSSLANLLQHTPGAGVVEVQREVAASQLCFGNMRVARLLDPQFLTILLHKQVPNLLTRDPTANSLVATLPSMTQSFRMTVDDLKGQFQTYYQDHSLRTRTKDSQGGEDDEDDKLLNRLSAMPNSPFAVVNAESEQSALFDEIPCSKDLRGGLLRAVNRRGLQLPMDEAVTVYFAWKLLLNSALAQCSSSVTPLQMEAAQYAIRKGIAQQSFSLIQSDSAYTPPPPQQQQDDATPSVTATMLRYAADHIAMFSTSHTGRIRNRFTAALSSSTPLATDDAQHSGGMFTTDDRNNVSVSLPFLQLAGIVSATDGDEDEERHHHNNESRAYEDSSGGKFLVTGAVGRPPELSAKKKMTFLETLLLEEEQQQRSEQTQVVAASSGGVVTTSVNSEPGDHRAPGPLSSLPQQQQQVSSDATPSHPQKKYPPLFPCDVIRSAIGNVGSALDVTDAVVAVSNLSRLRQDSKSIAIRRASLLRDKLNRVSALCANNKKKGGAVVFQPRTSLAIDSHGSSSSSSAAVESLMALGIERRIQAAVITTAMHFPTQYALRYQAPPSQQYYSLPPSTVPSVGLSGMLPLAGPSLVALHQHHISGDAAVGQHYHPETAARGSVSEALLEAATVELEGVVHTAQTLLDSIPQLVTRVKETLTEHLASHYKAEDESYAAARDDRKRRLLDIHRAQVAIRHEGLPPLCEMISVDGDALARQVAAIPVGSQQRSLLPLSQTTPHSSTLLGVDGDDAKTMRQVDDLNDVAELLASTKELHKENTQSRSQLADVAAKRQSTAQLRDEVLAMRRGLLERVEQAKSDRKSKLNDLQTTLQSTLDSTATAEQQRRMMKCAVLREDIAALEVDWQQASDPACVQALLESEHKRRIAALEDEFLTLTELQHTVQQQQELFATSLIGRWNAPHRKSSLLGKDPQELLKHFKPRRLNVVCYLSNPSSMTLSSGTARSGDQPPVPLETGWRVQSSIAVAEQLQQQQNNVLSGGTNKASSHAARVAVHDFLVDKIEQRTAVSDSTINVRKFACGALLWCDSAAAFASRQLRYEVEIANHATVPAPLSSPTGPGRHPYYQERGGYPTGVDPVDL